MLKPTNEYIALQQESTLHQQKSILFYIHLNRRNTCTQHNQTDYKSAYSAHLQVHIIYDAQFNYMGN